MDFLWAALPAVEGFSITFPGLIQGGGVGFSFFIGYLALTGRLYAASTVDALRKDYKEALERERENTQIWKSAAETGVEVNRELSVGLRDATDGLHTVEHLIRAIRGYGEERPHAVAMDQDPPGDPTL